MPSYEVTELGNARVEEWAFTVLHKETDPERIREAAETLIKVREAQCRIARLSLDPGRSAT